MVISKINKERNTIMYGSVQMQTGSFAKHHVRYGRVQ